jgi:pyruvate dehydrogenase E2 component (dihydrolipoamide acetyltransferase)
MADKVVMPKQGNSVESCVIDEWKKKEGDAVAVGDIICEAETDKSTIEVESTAAGTILKILYKEGSDVPVMLPIAIVGTPGEDIAALIAESGAPAPAAPAAPAAASAAAPAAEPAKAEPAAAATGSAGSQAAVSPRARNLAAKGGVDLSSVEPTGPKGRVIERDVKAALEGHQPLTPTALAAVGEGVVVPASGSGIGGRVLLKDLKKKVAAAGVAAAEQLGYPGNVTEIPVKGVRKVTAKRMLESMQTTAQLTLNAYADATVVKGLRAKFKAADPALGVGKITLNDLVMFAVAYTLKQFPEFNAHYLGDKIVQYDSVHLGMAVDSPKGLMVACIRNADSRSLRGLSTEAKRLVDIIRDGKAQPDDISGSTFSVTNVGAFGINTFTPIINIPEVAILGVAAVEPRPVRRENGSIEFVDMMGLSLTINHQAVDGAPGAKFLKSLCDNIANIDMLLAVEG